MECRSTEKRLWIVEHYNVVTVAHIQLLNGQEKYSDAGAIIKNDYYIFEATHKSTGQKDIIQCGMGAARDFLQLLNINGLPIFNPLVGANCEPLEENENLDKNASFKSIRKPWDPVAKQLYNAIMWLIVLWDAKPGTQLFELKENILKFQNYIPFDSKVKHVNNMIKKGGKGKKLTEMIDALKNDNNIREDMCRFDLLTNVIKNYTDRDGKMECLESYFD